MKRSLVILAWLGSAALHAAVAAALALQPAAPDKIELPKPVQLVKLAPPMPEPAPEPVAAPKPPPPKPKPKPVRRPQPKPKPVAKPAPEPKPEPKPEPVAKPAPRPEPQPEPQPEPAQHSQPEVEQTVAKAASYKPVDVSVAYLNNPKPPYPRLARRRGWEGTVVLQLDLDEKGQPRRVEIADSSGYRVLDKAALATVQHWRFQPATRNGEAVAASNVRVPIQFSLRDG